MNMDEPAPWVKDIVEKTMGKSKMIVGKVIDHPDGYKVKVISGQFWSNGRVSNWWTWRRVKADGKLGRAMSGYGW